MLTNFPNGLTSFGIPLFGSSMLDQGKASVFFVDGNRGNDGYDGKSWDNPFATLAKGLAECDAFQRKSTNKAWAQRSKLFVAGDSLTEDLTKLAEKTDVIGVGQCDGIGPARVKGNHVIAASPVYMGCRFFNVAFHDNDAGGTTITIPTQQSGIVFDNCWLLAGPTTAIGILMTAATDFAIRNCRFHGSWNAGYSTAIISIGNGSSARCIIENNLLENTHATGVGILVGSTRSGNGYIRNNLIRTTGMAINDDSDTFVITDNRIVVGTNKAAGTSVDINAVLAANNIVTGADGTISIPACNFGAQS